MVRDPHHQPVYTRQAQLYRYILYLLSFILQPTQRREIRNVQSINLFLCVLLQDNDSSRLGQLQLGIFPVKYEI